MPAIKSQLEAFLTPDGTPERCGLVLKGGKLVEVDNVHPEPTRGFHIPIDLLHKNAKKLVGTWHTHPGQDSQFSQQDYFGFAQWPGINHYIVGTDGVRVYQADDNGIVHEVECA